MPENKRMVIAAVVGLTNSPIAWDAEAEKSHPSNVPLLESMVKKTGRVVPGVVAAVVAQSDAPRLLEQ